MANAIERPELSKDERFGDAKTRKANSAALISVFDDAFESWPMAHWKEQFDRFDVWWVPAQTMAEVLEDPQIAASGGFINVDLPGGDPYFSVNSPITFRGDPLRTAAHAPSVGEHTAEVLAELGVGRGPATG